MKNIKIVNEFEASAVSLGCMRMGGLDEKRVDAIMDTAIENGINFFDHADIYGKGNAEKVFGEYLKRHGGQREKIMIQTKCAIHDGQYDFSKEHILKSVDGSLSRLGTEYIDVLLLHRPLHRQKRSRRRQKRLQRRLINWKHRGRLSILAFQTRI